MNSSKPRNKHAKIEKKQGSLILKIGLFIFISYFVISFCHLQYKIYKKNQSLEKSKQSYNSAQQENKELKSKKKNFNEETYAERVAREILGYGFPDEKEYRQAS